MTSLGWDAEDAAGTTARGTGPRTGPAAAVADLRLLLREAPRRPTLLALAVCVGSLLLYGLVRHLVGVSMVDMVVYRAEGAAVAHHGDLYGITVTQWHLTATYPPFAAMLFTPTALLPVGPLRVLVSSGNLLLLGGLAALGAELVGWPRRGLRPALVLLAVGLGVWLEPVFTTLRYGQINLLLDCLVLYDLNRPDGSRGKGVGIGLATAIKLTPGLFAVYLLLSGRSRAAVTAGATCVATMLLGAVAMPDASRAFWTDYVFDTSRVGKVYIVDNQSLRGLIERLLHTPSPGPVALLATGLTAVAGLAVAVALHRDPAGFPRARAWSVLCVAVTGLLVSPISWTHHWVWCVPLLLLLAAEAARERTGARSAGVPARRGPRRWGLRRPWRAVFLATGTAFCSYAMWLVPHHDLTNLHIALPLQPFAGIYPLVGLAFLGLAAERLRRYRGRRRRAERARSWPLQRASLSGQERGQLPVHVQAGVLAARRDPAE
ncbi:glycosyltransferase 87 family protein [Streptacidiphilus cavernicola]|uniref:Glycosyltransferase 87 family protein n=1 Tax=Streptacidiphilus cavernicola TaxID=3342716 RepID=A0ABV6W009_9ACTN